LEQTSRFIKTEQSPFLMEEVTYSEINKEINKSLNKQANKQTNNKQTNNQTNKQTKTVEIGQGINTKVLQGVAYKLGIPLNLIKVNK
jgi:hypothetical protein